MNKTEEQIGCAHYKHFLLKHLQKSCNQECHLLRDENNQRYTSTQALPASLCPSWPAVSSVPEIIGNTENKHHIQQPGRNNNLSIAKLRFMTLVRNSTKTWASYTKLS